MARISVPLQYLQMRLRVARLNQIISRRSFGNNDLLHRRRCFLPLELNRFLRSEFNFRRQRFVE